MTLAIVIGVLAGTGALYELLTYHGIIPPVPWRRMTLAFLGRVWPDEGCHSPHASIAMTPAPGRAAQAPRPGDPRSGVRAVRAGATTPAPRGAARAGQAPSPAVPGPPWQPAAAPQSAPTGGAAADPAPNGPPSIPRGPGQHPSGGHRESWVIWHGPPQPGRLAAVGYGPFDRGPRAVIPRSRVSLRVTGELPVLGGDALPALTRRYREDLEKWWDRPVNEP